MSIRVRSVRSAVEVRITGPATVTLLVTPAEAYKLALFFEHVLATCLPRSGGFPLPDDKAPVFTEDGSAEFDGAPDFTAELSTDDFPLPDLFGARVVPNILGPGLSRVVLGATNERGRVTSVALEMGDVRTVADALIAAAVASSNPPAKAAAA